MDKKILIVAAALPALFASSLVLACDDKKYDHDRNYNYDYRYDKNYDRGYYRDRDYRDARVYLERRNAAAYSDYVNNNYGYRYNYSNYNYNNYNYGNYNYGYRNNCACPAAYNNYNYSYYSSNPGTTNYTSGASYNCRCLSGGCYAVYENGAYRSYCN